jgi:hypothetical protein
MSINAVAPYQTTTLYAKITDVKTAAIGEQVFNVPKATTPKNSSTVYKELSGKYDVRNATFEEIVEISNGLYEAGEITFKEHIVLIFDYGRATNNIKRYAQGYIAADFDMYETSANSNGQRDWIAEYEARASKDFKYGNLSGYQSKMKVLTLLQRLDT